MPWAKLDDMFWAHPKTYLVGLDSLGLHMLAMSYCAHYLTDGTVPHEWVGTRVPKGDKRGTVAALVRANLWSEVGAGYLLNDFLDYNPSKAEVEAQREKWREKKRKQGENGASSRWDSPGEGPEESPGVPRGESHGPVPVPNSSLQEENVPDSEHVRLSELLAELVEGNGSKRPHSNGRWPKDVRLMVERDGRTLEGIEAAIRWCQADDFWRANVMSMPKLRKQYDKLRLAAARDAKPAEKPKWERQAKVMHLGAVQNCGRCENRITNEQKNNQSGMCDECYEAHTEKLLGPEAA